MYELKNVFLFIENHAKLRCLEKRVLYSQLELKLKRVVKTVVLFDFIRSLAIRSELTCFVETYMGLKLYSSQQRSNLVGTHSLSLTLRECLAHKNSYVIQKLWV